MKEELSTPAQGCAQRDTESSSVCALVKAILELHKVQGERKQILSLDRVVARSAGL